MRLAVDAMGGDHAPDAIVRGCIDALDILAPGDELILVGRENDIRDIMHERSVPADAPIRIVHADTVVEMHESPVEAVRAKKDSSLVKMMLLGAGRLNEPAADYVSRALAEGPFRRLRHRGNHVYCLPTGTHRMRRAARGLKTFAARPTHCDPVVFN